MQLLYDQTVDDVGDGPQISFAVFTDDGTRSLLTPKQIYDRLKESMSSTLADLDGQGWNWLNVDAQCASWLMDIVANQGQHREES